MKDINDIEELEKPALEPADMEVDEPQEKVQEPKRPEGILGSRMTLEDVIQRETQEEQVSLFSIRSALGGVVIERIVRRQIWWVLLVFFFLIIYISNRYVCQKKIVEIDRLEKVLNEEHYRATVFSSRLTEESRESNVMKLLGDYGDSTLAVPQDPPYLIKIDE